MHCYHTQAGVDGRLITMGVEKRSYNGARHEHTAA